MQTNIAIDDQLVATVMRVFDAKNEREAVEQALETAVRVRQQAAILELRGIGWEGDEEEVRGNRWRYEPE